MKHDRIAVVRAVSPRIGDCELTHLTREPIDVERARRQHQEYVTCLARLGCRVVEVEPLPDLPDAVFVEDVAVVFDELCVITRPGAPSRRPEVDSVADTLSQFRRVAHIRAPGTVDGGDVLCVGRTVYIGETSRTNSAGIEQFRELVSPDGYEVCGVPVAGCLHLKTGVTTAGRDTVVINPKFVGRAAFARHTVIEVDAEEPSAANVLCIGEQLVVSASFPRTHARLAAAGFACVVVVNDELAKAEAALTCCSLILTATEVLESARR